jgi:hypothetical protein
VLSGVLLLIAATGLSRGAVGQAGRLFTTVGAVGLVFAGIQVGSGGGELVYRHGAANAYVSSAATADSPATPRERGERDDD